MICPKCRRLKLQPELLGVAFICSWEPWLGPWFPWFTPGTWAEKSGITPMLLVYLPTQLGDKKRVNVGK